MEMLYQLSYPSVNPASPAFKLERAMGIEPT